MHQKVEPNKRQTGTKPKIFKRGKCCFEVQTEAKLKGNSTIHEKGNVNYVEMVKCSRCEYVFKTAGLLRRHLKSEHGINLTSIPESQDGAKSLPRQQAENGTETRVINCDRCSFKATNN